MPSLTRVPDRSTPFRDDLCRTATFTLTRAVGEGGDGLTIEGYGAVFNSVTEIDSWEGAFQEVIAPGAFRKSLKERTPKMQFDHGRHPLLGSLPLGRWDVAEEDARGLHLVGRLTDNWLVQPFRDSIRDGGVEGMSFRFSVEREEWTDRNGKKIRDDELADLMWHGAGDRGPILRTLKELKVTEAGPVTWPAYEDTTVGVRDQPPVVTIDLAHINTPQARRDLARAVVIADAAAARPTQTPDSSPSGQHDSEPQATDRSADEHPTSPVAPRVTDRSAGEHSSTAEIDARRTRMRAKAAEVKAAMSLIQAS
jgi:hypothetical protein